MIIFNLIKKFIINFFNLRTQVILTPKIIGRAEHNISRKNISQHVLKVLYTLKESGYQSYLVGGGVRDLLLQQTPKDFDIVTNAEPEKIRKLFRNSYIVGKRFQLVHVYFDKKVVEVATFRNHHNVKNSKEGMILRDNVYGNIEQDVLRRDFTINALYYNIVDYSLVDYIGGLEDLTKQQLRLIGDPNVRYREDPVRMLRAIRFAAKLDFKFHESTERPLYKLSYLLNNIAPARLYDEYVKLFFTGDPVKAYNLLKQYGLLYILFPNLNLLTKPKYADDLILRGLKQLLGSNIIILDQLKPAYLMAIFLWYNVLELVNKFDQDQQVSPFIVYKKAIEQLLMQQNKTISLSKKIRFFIKDLWLFQLKFERLSGKPGKKADKLIKSIKFESAFYFLALRASLDPKAKKHYRWWSKYLKLQGNNIST